MGLNIVKKALALCLIMCLGLISCTVRIDAQGLSARNVALADPQPGDTCIAVDPSSPVGTSIGLIDASGACTGGFLESGEGTICNEGANSGVGVINEVGNCVINPSTVPYPVASQIISAPEQLTKGPSTVADLLNNAFTFLNYLIGVIGVFSITASGFMYVISVGNPQKTKNALMSIIYTGIGFAVAVLARSIATFVLPKVSNQSSIQGLITEGMTTFLWVTGIASLIIIILAGILYAVSVGEPQKTKTAKDAILYAAVGLVISVIAGAAVTALNNFLTTGRL